MLYKWETIVVKKHDDIRQQHSVMMFSSKQVAIPLFSEAFVCLVEKLTMSVVIACLLHLYCRGTENARYIYQVTTKSTICLLHMCCQSAENAYFGACAGVETSWHFLRYSGDI